MKAEPYSNTSNMYISDSVGKCQRTLKEFPATDAKFLAHRKIFMQYNKVRRLQAGSKSYTADDVSSILIHIFQAERVFQASFALSSISPHHERRFLGSTDM